MFKNALNDIVLIVMWVMTSTKSITYDENGKLIMRQTELYVPPKHFEWKKPSFKVDIQSCEDGAVIEIISDTFVKGVYIDFENCDPILSSNFFDLTNGEKYTVYAKTDRTADELYASLKIMSVYDVGR